MMELSARVTSIFRREVVKVMSLGSSMWREKSDLGQDFFVTRKSVRCGTSRSRE